jgi:anaerobic magnesium-protoporphyrin IX monomethyl ester cyclase
MMTRGKVVLFYPPYDGPPLGAPLSLLALAGTLRAAAFEVVLIDAAIEPNYLLRIEEECKSALCMGISVLTGPMIRGAIEAARHAKKHTPEVCIVFGGWHPTLCPESTLREEFVDVVVRGQGEITIVELAEALAGNKPLDFIPGSRTLNGAFNRSIPSPFPPTSSSTLMRMKKPPGSERWPTQPA